jgi:hypothetical protein
MRLGHRELGELVARADVAAAAGDRLAVRLARPCWPSGPLGLAARRRALAQAGPPRVTPVVLDCTCGSTGHCRLCN